MIPDTAAEKPIKGEVVAVGDGKALRQRQGASRPSVKVGDKVLFGKYSGQKSRSTATNSWCVKEDDIIAVVG